MRQKKSRREFLKDSGWMGVGASLAGSWIGLNSWADTPEKTSRIGMRCAPLERIRVGVIGIGSRGAWAVTRLSNIPHVEIVGLSDLYSDRVENAKNKLVKSGKSSPRLYFGSKEKWKALCDSPDIDLIYITTPWTLHTEMSVYAMRAGKHAASEVPIAVTLEDCWSLVETCEKTRRHCMMLENCCYGASELFALSLCRHGVLGTLVHGEGSYLHHGRLGLESDPKDRWRMKFKEIYNGNFYPTHGLGPICQYMGINRGDQMDFLTSVSSNQFGITEVLREKLGADDPYANRKYIQGDMNTSIIRTRLGRTILVRINTTNPHPYSRTNLIQGTKGIFADYPLRVALGDQDQWLAEKDLEKLKSKYQHPLLKSAGEQARKVGGHGGMDFLMDLRLCYCLKNGLPLDIDVYDSVVWSSLVALTEQSVKNGGKPVPVPDFTRGAWRSAKPLGLVDIDYSKV